MSFKILYPKTCLNCKINHSGDLVNFLALRAPVFDCPGTLCPLTVNPCSLFLAPTCRRTLWSCFPDLNLIGELIIWSRTCKPSWIWGWSLRSLFRFNRQESLCDALLLIFLHKQMFHIAEGRSWAEETVTRSCEAEDRSSFISLQSLSLGRPEAWALRSSLLF